MFVSQLSNGEILLCLARKTTVEENLPVGLRPASEALGNSYDSQSAIFALLGYYYLADDLKKILSYWQQKPNFCFLAVAVESDEWYSLLGNFDSTLPNKVEEHFQATLVYKCM